MGKIIFITGGARSGKSTFAEKYCKDGGENLAYIATSEILDIEMKDRIQKHRSQRGDQWTTYERSIFLEKYVHDILENHDYVLLDCITMYISNIMFSQKYDYEDISMDIVNLIENEIKTSIEEILEIAKKAKGNLVIVSNEIGMGIVPDNRLSRIYRDYVGRVNQTCAQQADEVYLVVSSIPVKIK
ncbi:bifunctional adenosylcobinamide kinase/adenosylcobinamide-phosphate guanylyltransferase [Proteocatella sphenisci]|uniref:bifunctional adenosylcobinamide kinase/adenosylcobinamide-phosphate guanylyltransferase n=1 Tax=Proteocatella sphenisci TaxID=181070 RepID=UPI00048C57F5|nr:bifunctional adenosylcobinamide kinase/adenosylcobinamide-phosphate guanylyltransferase [Proteocatella sphenisci]